MIGVRNIFVLFFSAMAVSLVILIVFFSLFFKNLDNWITFDTKLPESAPDIGTMYGEHQQASPSRADGITHSTINVPQDVRSTTVTPETASSEALTGPTVGAGVPVLNDEVSTEVTDEPTVNETTETTAEPVLPKTTPKSAPKVTTPEKKSEVVKESPTYSQYPYFKKPEVKKPAPPLTPVVTDTSPQVPKTMTSSKSPPEKVFSSPTHKPQTKTGTKEHVPLPPSPAEPAFEEPIFDRP